MGTRYLPVVKSTTLAVSLLITFHATLVIAQTAFRCDNNGQTVYSDRPCPPGHSAKAVTTSQDSAGQRAASQAAAAQMRKDNAELNKRLSEREKLEAKERADARRVAKKTKADAAKSRAAKSSGKAKSAKLKAAKATKAPPKKKAKPTDNTVQSKL